jgi:uncharacterized protein
MQPNSPNLIQLEITSLTKSGKTSWWDNLFRKEKSETYRLELGAKEGQPVRFKLPILIGYHEAMTIAVVLEGMKPKFPLTIDLLQNATYAFGYILDSIVIDNIEDGIFTSKLQFSGGDKRIELFSRTSDAITLALKYDAPIYVMREVVEDADVQSTLINFNN